MKASRRSRGAREMEKKREKREVEKNKKKKEKKETRAPRPHHRQPCRLHPRAKLRFAFGLRVGEAAAGRKKWRALGKWWDEIGVGGTKRWRPGGCWPRYRKWKNGKRKMSWMMRSDVWKDDGDAAGRCFGKMVIGGFWKNGGEQYLVGRWCFVDIKKVVGRDVRRRTAKPGGRELAYWRLWGRYGKNGGGRCWPAGAGRNVLVVGGRRWAL